MPTNTSTRRRHRQARCGSKRPSLPNISLRPSWVNDREEPGHWEADQIIGKANRSSMLWLSERVTRYSIEVTMPLGCSAEAMVGGLVEACEQIPAHPPKSVTFDQGSEWADWELGEGADSRTPTGRTHLEQVAERQ